jgi:hypothetical protein
MTQKDAVLKEVQAIPDRFLGELLDFIQQLKLRAAIDRSGTALASEPTLAADWQLIKEDEAWRDL